MLPSGAAMSMPWWKSRGTIAVGRLPGGAGTRPNSWVIVRDNGRTTSRAAVWDGMPPPRIWSANSRSILRSIAAFSACLAGQGDRRRHGPVDRDGLVGLGLEARARRADPSFSSFSSLARALRRSARLCQAPLLAAVSARSCPYSKRVCSTPVWRRAKSVAGPSRSAPRGRGPGHRCHRSGSRRRRARPRPVGRQDRLDERRSVRSVVGRPDVIGEEGLAVGQLAALATSSAWISVSWASRSASWATWSS